MSEFSEKRVRILRELMRLEEAYNWLPDCGSWRSMRDDLATLHHIDNWIEQRSWDCWLVVPSADDIMQQVIDAGRGPLWKRDEYDWEADQVGDMLEEMQVPMVPLDEEVE